MIFVLFCDFGQSLQDAALSHKRFVDFITADTSECRQCTNITGMQGNCYVFGLLCFVNILSFQIFQCGRTKKLYPSKRYFLIHLLPGVILAIVGLVLFAFLETDDNYKYTHSCWHVAMSTSIVFLLPAREQKGIDLGTNPSMPSQTNSDTNTSTRIVLNSYSGISNGHAVSADDLGCGDNPAYNGDQLLLDQFF